MPDLTLHWDQAGTVNSSVVDGLTTDVDGMTITLGYSGHQSGSNAFLFERDQFREPTDASQTDGALKLYGIGGGSANDAGTPVSTSVLNFAATDGSGYADVVENVEFRISDIDGGTGADEDGGTSGLYRDGVAIRAYDAAGNEVPVTFTLGSGVIASGNTLAADPNASSTTYTDESGSALVQIAGPVARIEIDYNNFGDTAQRVLVGDVSFSTVSDGTGNSAPVAVDDRDDILANGVATANVLANDSDPDGDALSVISATSSDGTVSIDANDNVIFTPNPGFRGEAVIDYTISDGQGGTASAQLTVGVTSDGVVYGDETANFIDTSYTGDNDGDLVDAGDAVISGDGPNDDRIEALGGNDTVEAGLGDDTVSGGEGDDSLSGGEGDDSLMGDAGDDTLDGGQGNDVLEGGAGNDSLLGNDGMDTIIGGTGDDTIVGGDGADSLSGGDGRDLFVGGTVGDVIDGGSGPAGDRPDGIANDYDTLDLRGSVPTGGAMRITYTSTDQETGFVEYFNAPARGTDKYDATNYAGRLDFTDIEKVVPCFTPGTVIATPIGERLVEDLKIGDRIITRDNGVQEIRWIGTRALTGHELARAPQLRPVLIQAGSLGHGLPEHDMMVSPNHRMLINNDKTALYFDEREVLAAAKHLTRMPGIESVDVLGVTYVHFMFDQHEVVLSNGYWTESFQPGKMALDGLGGAQRKELFELFPDLKSAEGVEAYGAARRTLKKHEARMLAS